MTVKRISFVSFSIAALLTAALAFCAPQAKADVLAFWNFNDGTTDTVSGETLTSVEATIANGKLTATNGYLAATGANGGVTNFTLPTGTSDYTLSAFLTTSNLAKVGIVSWGTNSNTKCNAFRTTDTNKGLDSYWWGNDLAVDGYPVVSGGIENHVVSIGIGKAHYLYLNGQLIGSSTTNARAESNQNFCVGKTILDNERLNGTLDNVSIYNNAMDHLDIINIASSRYNGMTNWWKSSDTYDRVSGINISAGASGTTVLTGDTGTMVFNRALSDNETAYYTGQLSAAHTYIVNDMAGSLATSTTWLNNGGTYALTDASTTPLGIYVGGNTNATTLNANSADLDSVNKIVVLGGGVLGLTDAEINFTPSATTHVTIDGGTLLNAGSGTMTVNLSGKELIGKIESNSNVNINVANEAQFTGSFAGSGEFTKTGEGTLVQTAANRFTGTTNIAQGTYKLAGAGGINGTVNVESGTSLYFDNDVPHNTESDLTINVKSGGTVEFDMTTAERSAVTAIASAGKNVTFTGDGTWIKSGTGELHCASANNQPVTFALSSSAKMIIEEGTFYNGGWQKQNWSDNYAELVIKADGAINFWDGVKMQVGGLTGEEGAQITATASNSKGLTIGAGTTSDQTFTYNGTMLCNIASTITKTGASTQVLNGDMTRVAVQANEGTLVLGTAGNEIVVDTDSSIKTGGGAVRVDGNLTIKSGLLTVQGDWTGTGDIKINTGGQLRITTNFSYPNDITLNGGILRNATDGRTVSVDAPINVISDSYIQSGWSDYVTLKGALKGSGNITVPSDSGYVVFTGDASQFKGALSLYSNIRVGKSKTDSTTDCVNFIGDKKISLYAGGLIQNNDNNITITNDLDVLGESGFKTGWSKSITITGNVTGSAKLKQVSDSGWLILKTHSDNDAFTGPFQTGWASTSSRGQTRLAAEQPLGANAGTLYNYGYIDMNGFSQIFKGVMDDGANNKKGRIYNTTDAKSTLTLDIKSQNLMYAGTIEGNIEVIINSDGEGTQTFSNGGSSYTGNLVINGGKVVVTGSWSNSNKTSALGKLQSGRTVTVNKGAELVLAQQDVIANSSTNSLVQIIVDGGKLSNSGTVYNNLANTIFKNGAQMYASNGNATWLGYKLSNKVSVLRTDAAADPVEFSSDLTKEKATYSFGHTTSLYIEDVTSESATELDTLSDLIISAIITNPHNESARTFYKDGKGTLEFTAANTFNGTASIREGVLRLSGEGSLGTATAAVSEGATLEFAVDNEKWFNNTVTGSGTLLKTGDGTLYLNGTDANPINANALNVEGGSLMFKGLYTGDLIVKNGALFSPGNSVGTLTINDGDFTLKSGATFLLEVGKDDSGAVITDQLIVNGNAYFDEGSILLITMDGESPLVGNDLFSSVITADNAAEIVDAVSATLQSYYFTDLSVSLTDPTTLLISGRLDPNAVPEPSTWALLILGAMGLFLIRKKNNR
ncbi:MAG: autotransporter-associated beta strand repeat-containing protein [Thermoguttaceae bacterium]|nr:autotransporter-associated beta strand repeat-containing protein [Thermoguttaceae bacterium]